MSYCIYLRKSRKDLEAEQSGQGETLARHESALLSLARQKNLIIGNIYREIVSGETIAARPVMQQLLREVEGGMWDGVLVMEIERLARGDTIDQGTVQRAFQYSNTYIITPQKTYDPSNEFDEEYFEFGLFMSRREYKTIKRRMQAGRYSAAREGKWPFNTAPYGYRRIKLQNEKGWTLEPDDREAPIVRLIYSLFTGPDRSGVSMIRKRLNQQGIKPRKGSAWTDSTVRDILSNPVYDGKVAIGRRKVVPAIENGLPTKTRPRSDTYDVYDGRHKAIIDHRIYQEAQSYLGLGSPKPPDSYGVKSPLAGLVVCAECKKRMQRRPAAKPGIKNGAKYDMLICKTDGCLTVGSPLDLVEQELISALEDWVKGYELTAELPESRIPELEALLSTARQEHETLEKQKTRLYDLLEQGIYDPETFLERSRRLQDRLQESQAGIVRLEADLAAEEKIQANLTSFLPSCRELLGCYWDLDIQDRNKALKLLIDSVEYRKTSRNRKGEAGKASFELTIKPRIPRI